MKDPRCPLCGWDVELMNDDDPVAVCTRCKEYVVAEEAADLDPEWEEAGDLSLAAEVAADFQKEFGQDEYEADSRNYGFDDEYLEREA